MKDYTTPGFIGVAAQLRQQLEAEAASSAASTSELTTPARHVGSDDLLGCGVCGGRMVFVRGRYPGTDNRKVCPTCLADRMDMIRELTSAEYGQAYEAHSNTKAQP